MSGSPWVSRNGWHYITFQPNGSPSRQRLRRLYRHPCGGDQVILDYTPLGTITEVFRFGDQRQVLCAYSGLTFQNSRPEKPISLELGGSHRGSS